MTVVDLQTVQAFFSRSEPIYLRKFQIICGVWTFRTLAFWMYRARHRHPGFVYFGNVVQFQSILPKIIAHNEK